MNIAANLDCAAFHYPDHRAVTEGDKAFVSLIYRHEIGTECGDLRLIMNLLAVATNSPERRI
jgi:hypothetical protein